MPDFVAGEIVTANKMNQIPKGTLGYAFRTTNITNLSGGPVDLPDLSVQVTVPAGRVLRVVGYVHAWSASGQGEEANFLVREGTNNLQIRRLVTASVGGASSRTEGGAVEALILPSPGVHTYKLSFERATGASNWTCHASVTQPAYILVEDLGANPNA